ncbi:hypothetical protein MKZ38_005050 [Zalerion maritima]|uniref:Major facilitator superfamily (MFS) profile domain-containing protein n=1 Tax=Zalerion maritima TaxID=339359 RepID=A0AAD5WR76_9PEZI|nr:hypothetical protein MKZ38_005050 [Zalerion maritima]
MTDHHQNHAENQVAVTEAFTPHPASATVAPPHSVSDVDVEATAAGNSSGRNDNSSSYESSPTRAAEKAGLGMRPDVFKSTLQEVMFVFMAIMATATSSFFTGSTVVVTESIGNDLSMTQGQISWISAAATLTAGSFQLGFGQLADLLGRKPMFLIGLGCFGVFSLLTGFAQNPFWMDAMCGVLGLFSAMVVPPAIGILGAAYSVPSRRKNVAFAAFSAGNPLGFVFGSIVCGIATKVVNWRGALVLLCIIWVLLTLLGAWAIPADQSTSEPLPNRLKKVVKTFDSLGTVLTIVGTGLFTTGLTLGPTDGWASPHIIVFLILGVALLVCFGYWQTIYSNPLMPPYIWKDTTFTLLNLIVLFGMMAFTSCSFWLSYFMQAYVGLQPLMVAVYLIPQALAGIGWNIVAAAILHSVNNKLILLGGGVSYLASTLLLMYTPSDTSAATIWYWPYVFPALILAVAGADLQFNVANMYIMQSFPSEQQSLAGSVFNTFIRLATTIGLGLTTAAYESTKKTEEGQADPILQYRRAYLVSVVLAAISLLICPFVKIGTQGNQQEESDEDGVLNAPGSKNNRGAEAKVVGEKSAAINEKRGEEAREAREAREAKEKKVEQEQKRITKKEDNEEGGRKVKT